MKKKAAKALDKSIRHWMEIIAASHTTPLGEIGMGVEECPLCEKFWDADCVDCPIMQKTGKPYCNKTPYYDVYDVQREYRNTIAYNQHDGTKAKELRRRFHKAALREFEFLKSLREPTP